MSGQLSSTNKTSKQFQNFVGAQGVVASCIAERSNETDYRVIMKKKHHKIADNNHGSYLGSGAGLSAVALAERADRVRERLNYSGAQGVAAEISKADN